MALSKWTQFLSLLFCHSCVCVQFIACATCLSRLDDDENMKKICVRFHVHCPCGVYTLHSTTQTHEYIVKHQRLSLSRSRTKRCCFCCCCRAIQVIVWCDFGDGRVNAKREICCQVGLRSAFVVSAVRRINEKQKRNELWVKVSRESPFQTLTESTQLCIAHPTVDQYWFVWHTHIAQLTDGKSEDATREEVNTRRNYARRMFSYCSIRIITCASKHSGSVYITESRYYRHRARRMNLKFFVRRAIGCWAKHKALLGIFVYSRLVWRSEQTRAYQLIDGKWEIQTEISR